VLEEAAGATAELVKMLLLLPLLVQSG